MILQTTLITYAFFSIYTLALSSIIRQPTVNPTLRPTSSPTQCLMIKKVDRVCSYFSFLPSTFMRCISYPQIWKGYEYVIVTASNLKDYVVERMESETLDITIFPSYNSNVDRNFEVTGSEFDQENGKLVGIALDGVPIYSSGVSGNIDLVHSLINSPTNLQIDRCGGIYGNTPNGIRYHYRVIPTCILGNTDSFVKLRQMYINDVEELLDAFESYRGQHILGYSINGYPIYSPYDTRGHLHSGLDSCNGKFDDQGNYGYYATPIFPYLIGCEGPGEQPLLNQDNQGLVNASVTAYSVCPGGYYPTPGLTGCSPCPAGFYSPASSSVCGKTPCPLGHYCPPATVKPMKCPAGRFGAALGLSSSECSGYCKVGYFCPPGSTQSDGLPCGSEDRYCPAGSGEPLAVSPGFYSLPDSSLPSIRAAQRECPVGYYCEGGARKPCPDGYFGASSQLSTSICSGICPRGHFCPKGATQPVPCPLGTFGDSEGLHSSNCSGLCHPGFWCPRGSTSPRERICAAGRLGDGYGLTSNECSLDCETPSVLSPLAVVDIHGNTRLNMSLIGLDSAMVSNEGSTHYCAPVLCPAGYFCPEGSTSMTKRPCAFPSYYCGVGSGAPTPVDNGYYTIGGLSRPGQDPSLEDQTFRTAQVICEPGYWCSKGVRTICAAGVYGEVAGLTTAVCSGLCHPGYYCPPGSTSATQHACGNPSLYCPEGSPLPVLVPLGFYSVTVSNPSNTSTNFDFPTIRSDIRVCPPGFYCIDGLKVICPAGTYGSRQGLSTAKCDGRCSSGYYCPAGSTRSTQNPCPMGRYSFSGAVDGNCTGLCDPGYFCPLVSTSPRMEQCGDEYHFCPRGSGSPVPVSSGHYSTGGTSTTRMGQVLCVVSENYGSPPSGTTRENICPSTTV